MYISSMKHEFAKKNKKIQQYLKVFMNLRGYGGMGVWGLWGY
jgi:hypothetical protein